MLIRHSLIYLTGRIIPGAASLLTLVVFTRLMTPEQYGNYALILTAAGILNAVVFQWIGLSFGRFSAEYSNQTKALISTTFTSYAMLALAALAVAAIATLIFKDQDMCWIIVMTATLACAQAWFDLNLRVANAYLNPSLHSRLSSLKALLAILGSVIFFKIGLGVSGILAGAFIALAGTPCFFRQYWHDFSLKFYQRSLLKKFINYGAPLTVTFLLILVIDASDRFLLGWLIDKSAVGIYAPAYDLAQQSLGMLMGIVHLASFPLAVRALSEQGISFAQKQIKENLLLLLSISIPSTLGLMVLADDIAMLVIGENFRANAVHIIPVIAAAIFFSGLRSFYFDYAFQLGQRLGGQIWVVLTAALFNVALNLIWIPQYGTLGAAYASLIAFIVALLMSMFLGKKVFPLPSVHQDVYKLPIPASAMAGILLLLKNWHGSIALGGKIAAAGLMYAAIFLLLNIGQARSRLMIKMKNQ